MKFVLEIDLEVQDSPQEIITALEDLIEAIRTTALGRVESLQETRFDVLFGGTLVRDGERLAQFAVVDQPFWEWRLPGPIRARRTEDGWNDVKVEDKGDDAHESSVTGR